MRPSRTPTHAPGFGVSAFSAGSRWVPSRVRTSDVLRTSSSSASIASTTSAYADDGNVPARALANPRPTESAGQLQRFQPAPIEPGGHDAAVIQRALAGAVGRERVHRDEGHQPHGHALLGREAEGARRLRAGHGARAASTGGDAEVG